MSTVAFHTQIASIIEVLANAAVADICKVVDDGYDVLRLEILQCQGENKALKAKLLLMEKKLLFSQFYQRELGVESSWVDNTPSDSGKSYGTANVDHNTPAANDNLECQNKILSIGTNSTSQREPDVRSKAGMEEDSPDLIYIKEEQPDLDLKYTTPQDGGNSLEEIVTEEADGPLKRDVCKTSSLPLSTCDYVMHNPETQSEERDAIAETQVGVEKGSTYSGWKAMRHEAVDQGPQRTGSENSDGSSNDLNPHYCMPSGTSNPTCSYATRLDSHTPKDFSHGARQPARVSMVLSKPAINATTIFPSGPNMTKPLYPYPQQRSRKERFICKQCGKGWISASGLRTHQRVHTGERPFSCQQCEKTFNQLSNLKRHVRIHTGKKPFGCERCGDTFVDKVCLVKHQLKHCFGQR